MLYILGMGGAKQIQVRCRYDAMANPNTLIPHPRNPNKHPDKQLTAFAEYVKRRGWLRAVTVSRISGCVTTGHGQRLVAIALGVDVPIVYVDYESAADELEHVLADNALGGMGVIDKEALSDALSFLRNLDTDLASIGFEDYRAPDMEFSLDDEEQGGDEEQGSITELKDAVIFSSANQWGLPDLRADRLAMGPLPVDTIRIVRDEDVHAVGWAEYGYCGLDRLCEVPGRVVHFYIPDIKYGPLWTDAPRKGKELLKGHFAGVVGPDFSVFGDDPFAVVLYGQYQSRWVARYWQELGLPIVPNIRGFAKWMDMFCAGIPKEAPCVAAQCRSGMPDKREFARKINIAFDLLGFKTLYLYGGAVNRQQIEPVLSREFETVYLKDAQKIARERIVNHG